MIPDVTPRADLATASDAEVIRRSWTDPVVFDEIFRRHHGTLYGYLVRRVGPDAAADLAGDVFVQAFSARHGYRCAYASARPWLFGIATNLLRRYLRAQYRAGRANSRLAAELHSQPSEEAARIVERVAAEAAAPSVAERLKHLHARDREVLLLYAFSDLTYREMAEFLQIPIGTVRSRLSRARRQIKYSSEGA